MALPWRRVPAPQGRTVGQVLAAPESSLGSAPVLGPLGRAPRQRRWPSGISGACLLRRAWKTRGAAARKNPSKDLPARVREGQSRPTDGQPDKEAARFLASVCLSFTRGAYLRKKNDAQV